jgi:hypothetical protein
METADKSLLDKVTLSRYRHAGDKGERNIAPNQS